MENYSVTNTLTQYGNIMLDKFPKLTFHLVYPGRGSATSNYSVVPLHTHFMPWRNHKKPMAKRGRRLIHDHPPIVGGVRCEYPVES